MFISCSLYVCACCLLLLLRIAQEAGEADWVGKREGLPVSSSMVEPGGFVAFYRALWKWHIQTKDMGMGLSCKQPGWTHRGTVCNILKFWCLFSNITCGFLFPFVSVSFLFPFLLPVFRLPCLFFFHVLSSFMFLIIIGMSLDYISYLLLLVIMLWHVWFYFVLCFLLLSSSYLSSSLSSCSSLM